MPNIKPPDSLPRRSRRGALGKEPLWTLEVPLKMVTVSLGGGIETRRVGQPEEVIRVPSVRGHLRQQWRALYGGHYTSSKELGNAEQALWGGILHGKVVRSQVEIQVSVENKSQFTSEDVDWKTDGFYALWTAQSQRTTGKPAAQRRLPGTRFRLILRVPGSRRIEVENTIRAWILFGGYGARTRRGLGSLTVESPCPLWRSPYGEEDKTRPPWLPESASKQAIQALFEGGSTMTTLLDPRPSRSPDDMPIYQGAGLVLSTKQYTDAERAWLKAVNWLKDFRQAQPKSGHRGEHDPMLARVRGEHNNRPGRSNWPEADKLRHLEGPGPWAHTPQHNDTPVWPRASFGLPIGGQFQTKPGSRPEPDRFIINWYLDREKKDRLGSPLIVKALPLADGSYVAAALWFYRGFPEGGKVSSEDNRGTADFDQLVAPGDNALYAPLQTRVPAPFAMRTAFLNWVVREQGAREVASIRPKEVL